MTNQGMIYDGVKAFSLRELSDVGWTIEGQNETDIQQLVNDAAWLYAVIQKRAGGVVSIPRVLMKGETEVEEDTLPFEFDIPDLMRRSSLAVDIYAQAYGLTVKNQFKDLRVRWFRPESVIPIVDETVGLERFERQAGTVKYVYAYDAKNDTSPDGLWWIWQTGMAEVGPGTPKAGVAAGPASLLRAIDQLAIGYFSKGAIGQIYFTTETPLKPDQQKGFKKWWKQFLGRGLDTAYGAPVTFDKGFEPHKLSADPKDLMMSELDEDNRRDISAVYDTPEALVTGDAGSLSRATLDRITSNWINGTIMQQATLIVDAFNKHILKPAGYELILNPQGMTVNQEEERQRAQAVTFLVGAGFNPEWVAGMYDLVGPEDIPMMAEKQPVPEQLKPTFGAEEDADELEPKDDEEPEEKRVELGRLRRYIAKGGHLKRPFQSDVLTPAEIAWEVGKAQDAPFRVNTKQAEVIQLGDEKIDTELKEYYELIEELSERARKREITKSEFKKRLRDATIAALLLAFALGGGDESVEGAKEKLDEQRRIADESVSNLADEVYDGTFDETEGTEDKPSQTDEDGRGKLHTRLGLWAVTMAGLYSMGQVHAPPKVDADGVEVELNYTWQLGATIEHCIDCATLHGQTHTAEEWRRAGIMPQSPDLACGGWNCDCRLVATEAESIGMDF